jgi:hypothetical protein
MPSRRWSAEITDHANALAGLMAFGRTPERARRALASMVAQVLVEDRMLEQSDEVDVEVVSMQSAIYGVPILTAD